MKFRKNTYQMRHFRNWAFLLLLWSCGNKAQSLPSIALSIEGKPQAIQAELALTSEQQSKGLMFRKSMAKDTGMLFPFKQDKVLRFYMKNTLIPLSIAYLDKDGIIREIYDMKALDESITASKWPMRYALEMNLGWFENNLVQIGDRLIFADGSHLERSKLLEHSELPAPKDN